MSQRKSSQRTNKLRSAVSVLTFATLYQVSQAAGAVEKPNGGPQGQKRTLQAIEPITDFSEIPPLLQLGIPDKSGTDEVIINPSEPPNMLPEDEINQPAEAIIEPPIMLPEDEINQPAEDSTEPPIMLPEDEINQPAEDSTEPPIMLPEDEINQPAEDSIEPPIVLPEDEINQPAEDDQDEEKDETVVPEQPLEEPTEEEPSTADGTDDPSNAQGEEGLAPEDPETEEPEFEDPTPADQTPENPEIEDPTADDNTETDGQADGEPQIDEPSNEEPEVVVVVVDPSQTDDNPEVEDDDNTEEEQVDPAEPVGPEDPEDPADEDKDDSTIPLDEDGGDNGEGSGEGDDSLTPTPTDPTTDVTEETKDGETATDGDQNDSIEEGGDSIDINDEGAEDDEPLVVDNDVDDDGDDTKEDELDDQDSPDDDAEVDEEVEEEVTNDLEDGLEIAFTKTRTSRIRTFGSKQEIPTFSSKGVTKESDDPDNNLEMMAMIIGGGILFIIIVCALVIRQSRVMPGRATVAVMPVTGADIENKKTSTSHQKSLPIVDEENKGEADSIGKLTPRSHREGARLDSGPLDSCRNYNDGSPLKTNNARAQSTMSDAAQNSMLLSSQPIDMKAKDIMGQHRIFSAHTRTDVANGPHRETITTLGGSSEVNQTSELGGRHVLLPSIAQNKRSFGVNGTMIEDLPGFDDATVVADASQENRPEHEKDILDQ